MDAFEHLLLESMRASSHHTGSADWLYLHSHPPCSVCRFVRSFTRSKMINNFNYNVSAYKKQMRDSYYSASAYMIS